MSVRQVKKLEKGKSLMHQFSSGISTAKTEREDNK